MKTILSLVCAVFIALSANARKVEWMFDATDFTAINAATLYVKYTQGNRYSVKVRVEEKYADRVELSVSGKTLQLKFRDHGEGGFSWEDSLNVCVEVTSPVLTEVKCTGLAVFSSNDINVSEDFSVDMSGATKILLGNVSCRTCHFSVSGVSVMDVGNVKTKGAVVLSSTGASAMNIKHLESVDNVSFDCSGASKSEVSFKVRDIDSKISGAAKVKMKADARDMDMNVSGAAKLELGFTGEKMVVGSSGASVLNLDVDCKMIRATNSGANVFSIAGTTDDIKVECSGVARINTTKLNRF